MEGDEFSVARDIVLNNYLHIMAVSFLYWDHLATLESEILHIWRRTPKTPSAYWFLLNRYFAFAGSMISVIVTLTLTTLDPQSCQQYNLYRQIFLIVNQVLVCVLMTLRVYALYGCDIRVLCYMVGSGIILVGIASWSLFGQKYDMSEHGSACHIGLTRETGIRIAGAWEALFVYDSLLFGLTLYKTYKARRPNDFTGGMEIPILSLMVRDGAIYFAVMALANLSNILTFYIAGPFLQGGLSTFASSISVTMMSRLMLNLHESAMQGIFSPSVPTIGGSLVFQEVELISVRTV